MGDTEVQVEQYQNRLKTLAKRDYIYLFIGLIVVGIASLFLYGQFNPSKARALLMLNNPIDEETLKKTSDIAGIIQQRDINFISNAPTEKMGLTNPNPTATAILSQEEGQISSIASTQVTNTGKTYTVQEGDNLAYIAGIMYGDRNAWVRIAEANDLMNNPDGIYAGMVLVIPR